MKIYVGGLSYNAKESDLREVFERFGEVNSVTMIMDKMSKRSKGFGFVEMPNNHEAQEAIDELNNSELDGRTITVNIARPGEKTEEKEDDEVQLDNSEFEVLNIYIDSGSADKEDIVSVLSKIGTLYRLHGGNGIVYSEEDVNIFELFNS